MVLYVQFNSNARKPYDQQETRLSLYETLFDLCLTKNTKIAPPLSVAIGLFKNALNDQAQRIQQYAKNSLNFLRAFTYPLEPVFLKEFTIESKIEITSKDHQMPDLVLPSMNDEYVQNSELDKNEYEQSEIVQYLSKKQNSDQVKEAFNQQQANKRKFKYEDDEDDDDENESENENVYNPKNIAKKFQPNGHFQNRSLLNGRDVENSNGDDDAEEEEIEEEVISLNDQEDDEELEDESEMDEDDENDEEEDDESEEVEEEGNENENNLQDGELVEKLVKEKVIQQTSVESEYDPQNKLETKTTEKSPSYEVAEEVKNLLKETGDDYDDEESKELESESLCKTSQIADGDNQYHEISINKLEDEQIESEKSKSYQSENENSEQKEDSDKFPSVQEDDAKADESNDKFPSIQEDDAKADESSDKFPSIQEDDAKADESSDKFPSVQEDESKTEENKEFGEIEFNQICATLNLNALAKTN